MKQWKLPPEDRVMLINIIQKRLIQQRRNELLQEVVSSEQDFADGNISRGSVADLMVELDK